MNTHDFAKLLLAVPAQNLKDEGANDNYAARYSLKGVKVPGCLSIGGWVYPDTEVESTPAPVAKPQVRSKRLTNGQNLPAQTAQKASAKPAETKASEAKTVSMKDLAAMLAAQGIKLSL